MAFTWSLMCGRGKASNRVNLLIVCEYSTTILFLWLSPFATTTWARQDDLLGSIIPSFRSRRVSAVMNSESSGLYLCDLVAIGWQSSVRLENNCGGLIFKVLRPQIDREDLGPSYSKITLSCCVWKSKPSMRLAHSSGRTDRRTWGSLV